MALIEREFQSDSGHPQDLIIGWVISILLHCVLLIETPHWLQTFAANLKRQPSQPIAIEFVEVPLATKPPPEVKRRAVRDSTAGGKVIKTQPTPVLPPPPKLEPQSRQIAAVPATPKQQPQKATITPNIPTPPQKALIERLQAKNPPPASPKQKAIIERLQVKNPPPATQLPLKPKIEKTAVNPQIPKLPPKLQKPVAHNIPTQPQPSPRQTNKNSLPPKSPNKQVAARATPQTPSPQPSSSGAASRLGGPMSLSSSNLGSNYWAALPNSNRSNSKVAGIDARRDPDLAPYLEQLRQQVQQQWLPGITQHSRQTVVHFLISRSGIVSNLQLVQPSGSSTLDQAAIGAVKRAAPFAPLPPGYTQNHMAIRFMFNINVYGELDLGYR